MNSGIYAIVNLTNNKAYVGSAKNFYKRKHIHFKLLRENKHWNVKLQRSFNKYGESNFEFQILERAQHDERIKELENSYIAKLDSKVNGYNIADASFGDQLSNHPYKEEIIAKIKKTLNEKISLMTEKERKLKWGKTGEKNGMYGKTHNKETMKKIIEGTYKTIEEKYGGIHPNKGKKLSDEQKQKLKNTFKEKELNKGDKNPFYGKNHSNETKKKLSESKKGKTPSNIRIVVIDGVEYLGLERAYIETGIKCIFHKIKSNKAKYNHIYYKDAPKLIA